MCVDSIQNKLFEGTFQSLPKRNRLNLASGFVLDGTLSGRKRRRKERYADDKRKEIAGNE